MQSHLLKVPTVCDDVKAVVGPWPGAYLSGFGLTCEQSALLGPVQRQIDFRQPRRGELDGVPALQDRLSQVRAEKGEANQTANVAPGYAITFGHLLQGSGAARGELLKPRAPARDRLD